MAEPGGRGDGKSAATEWQHRQNNEVKNNSLVARKVLKADREKLRRDRLNEQFLELGRALDPNRPRNDKATILTDTIQMLKDLTSQVGRLKAEYTLLSDESHELTQEKNELREEKASLKSDIDGLHAQYQQQLRTMFSWTAVDPSRVVGTPPPYPYALPMTIPPAPGPIPVYPSLHPYPFFPSAAIPNPSSPFVSSISPSNTRVEAPPRACVPSSHPQSSSNKSQTQCLQGSRRKASNNHRRSEKDEDCSNVATELELKTPGSAVHSRSGSTQNQESCSRGRSDQSSSPQREHHGLKDVSSSSRCSSSHGPHEYSSESVGDGSVAEN